MMDVILVVMMDETMADLLVVVLVVSRDCEMVASSAVSWVVVWAVTKVAETVV
jgi:hypothetical protein